MTKVVAVLFFSQCFLSLYKIIF